MPKRRLVDAALLVAIVAAAAVALAQSWNRWLDPIIDVGRDLYIPEQLRHGVRLYAGIRYNYPPLAPYLLAAVTGATGSSLAAYAGIGIAVGVLVASAIYALARLAAGSVAAGSAALLFVACCLCGASTFGCNYVFPYSHAATLGVMFFLAFGACLYRHLYRGSTLTLTLLFALAATWCRIELAVAVMAIVIVVALIHRAHALWLYFAGLALTAALAWLLFGPALLDNVFPQSLLGGQSARFFYSHVNGFDHWPRRLGASAAAALAVAAMAALLALLERVRRQRFVALLIAASLAVGTWLIADAAFFQAWSVLQIVLLAFALRRPREPLLLLLLFALASSTRVYLNLSPAWYGFVFVLPTIVLIVYTLFEWLPARGAYSREVAMLWLPLVLLIAVRSLLDQRMRWSLKEFPVATSRGTFYDANPDRARVLAELLPRLAGARSLVVIPEGLTINYFARVPTPLTFHTFTPPETADPAVESRILAELQRHPPEFVALVTRDVREFGYRGFGIDYDQRLQAYLRRSDRVERQWRAQRFHVILLHEVSDGSNQLPGRGSLPQR